MSVKEEMVSTQNASFYFGATIDDIRIHKPFLYLFPDSLIASLYEPSHVFELLLQTNEYGCLGEHVSTLLITIAYDLFLSGGASITTMLRNPFEISQYACEERYITWLKVSLSNTALAMSL